MVETRGKPRIRRRGDKWVASIRGKRTPGCEGIYEAHGDTPEAAELELRQYVVGLGVAK